MSLREMCEKYEQKYGYDVPLPMFIYDFLFKHYDNQMDEHDPMDVVDCLICDTLYANKINLPVDIIAFDYRGDGFVRYHTPMVVINGFKGWRSWNHLVPVSISKSPEILISDELLQKRSNLTRDEWNKMFQFISYNYDLLMLHWETKIDSEELDILIQKRLNNIILKGKSKKSSKKLQPV